MSQLSVPRSVHDDFKTIEGYVIATFARYERVLVTRIPTLDEPRVADPDLALKRLGFLVETLAGFAVGISVRAVAGVVRRGFGAEARVRVGQLLGRILRDGSQAVTVAEVQAPVRFLSDPGRPLLDALGSRLLVRLCRSLPDVRTHVSAIHAEVTRTAPARLPDLARVLEDLAADDALELELSEQLAVGWQQYAALVSDREPVRRFEAKEELWRAWTRRVGGRAAPVAPTRDEIVSEGFLLQIA